MEPKFRPEASVIAFHGRPNPDEAAKGYPGTKGTPFHETGAMDWGVLAVSGVL